LGRHSDQAGYKISGEEKISQKKIKFYAGTDLEKNWPEKNT
jgi:hypothetical protein